MEQTIILVKAWPNPSQKYGETVCCAGVTPEGQWRRLFPIRYRHLTGDAQFNRWDVVSYRAETPRDDPRAESRRVHEQTLTKTGKIAQSGRAAFFDPLFRTSIQEAVDRGESLALVRPTNLRLKWKSKSDAEITEDRIKRETALRQGSLFDRELAQIAACPFDIRITFEDAAGRHDMGCGDWETAAAFFRFRKTMGDEGALAHLKEVYEKQYIAFGGVALALGNMAKHPNTWLLLGVLRLDETDQPQLPF